MSEICTVTGSNLFGQWFSNNHPFVGFQKVSLKEKLGIPDSAAKVTLLSINWSYNIFLINNCFYVTGSWRGNEYQCVKFKIPEECNVSSVNSINIVGNDYNLLIIDQNARKIWLFDLEKAKIHKELSLDTDTPLEDEIMSKRMRHCDKITKTVVTNNTCLHLTASGNVYSGLLPSHLDTSHCFGKVCDIACGYEHFILLTDAGRVYTWGNGRRLQLGHGDISNLDLPTVVEALAGLKITKISAGGWHSLALSEFGDLYTWGWNDTGQLGIKSSPDSSQGVLKTEGLRSYPLPTLVDIFDENDKVVELNVKDIVCGSRHSAILLEDNTVWTSECNKYGQLGFMPEVNKTVDHFKKVLQSKRKICKLKCGPWSTVLCY